MRASRVLAAVTAIIALTPLLSGVALGAEERQCRVASPVGATPCSGVRPGAPLRGDTTTVGCTMNFLFRARDGHRYIATAGHCLLDAEGERSWPAGRGPQFFATDGRAIGRGVYALDRAYRDFALIRLDRGVHASAQVCHFGGPTGIDVARRAEAVTLEHYGNGMGISAVLPARSAVARDTLDPEVVRAIGVTASGDSGSPVLRDGLAVGVISSITIHQLSDSGVYVTRLAPQLARAEHVLDIKLSLVTAPRL